MGRARLGLFFAELSLAALSTQGDLIQQARDKITQIQGTLSAEEEAERKRKEAERLKTHGRHLTSGS